jgi:AcrR family transcriptional regulator
MVTVGCERGFASASVGAVCARAGISRRSFYACFDGLQDCFLAVLDDGYRQVSAAVADGFSRARDWREGMRFALAELLLLFDRRPAHARVWLVESRGAGAWALERNADNVALLIRQVLERWPAADGAAAHPLAATGVFESVLAIVQTRALSVPRKPMLELLGPLIGLVVSPYLGQRAVTVEIERAAALARELESSPNGRPPRTRHPPSQPPALLSDPRAHRVRAALLFVASHPGVSNRQVAAALGIGGHAQVSALLSRLRCEGLVRKPNTRPGHPNSWSLTAYGRSQLDDAAGHTSGTAAGFTVTS